MFGLGHEIDAGAELDRVLHRPLTGLVGTSDAGITASINHRHLCEWVWNQGETKACVWHAWAMAAYMRGMVEQELGIGAAISAPSWLQAWVYAQWQAQADDGIPADRRRATNAGSRLGAGLRALHACGVVSAKRWAFDPAMLVPNKDGAIVLDLPLDVDIAAADVVVTGDYGASSADNPRVFDIALARRHFPVVAFEVCERFMELTGTDPEYLGLEGRPSVGRHMVVVVGRRPGWKLVKNSWGRGWGDQGYAWVADEYLASPAARDGAVVTCAPRARSST